jgi:hypothetical protein
LTSDTASATCFFFSFSDLPIVFSKRDFGERKLRN